MRTINSKEITIAVSELCIEANMELSEDMVEAIDAAAAREESPVGQRVLAQLQKNLEIAGQERIPICQDTGMAVVFVEIGQEVHIEGSLEQAIIQGVRQGYTTGCLRSSIVSDPIRRVNTGDNTPPVIHYDITEGDQLKITVAPKGFGSENMSKIYMLKPAQGIEGIKEAIVTAIEQAGPNACPPMVVGVGIGGNFEKAAMMAKKALLKPVNKSAEDEETVRLERDILEMVNASGIGPAGLGGRVTALAVNILTYPTHIAGLPVAVNICCHVNRHASRIL